MTRDNAGGPIDQPAQLLVRDPGFRPDHDQALGGRPRHGRIVVVLGEDPLKALRQRGRVIRPDDPPVFRPARRGGFSLFGVEFCAVGAFERHGRHEV